MVLLLRLWTAVVFFCLAFGADVRPHRQRGIRHRGHKKSHGVRWADWKDDRNRMHEGELQSGRYLQGVRRPKIGLRKGDSNELPATATQPTLTSRAPNNPPANPSANAPAPHFDEYSAGGQQRPAALSAPEPYSLRAGRPRVVISNRFLHDRMATSNSETTLTTVVTTSLTTASSATMASGGTPKEDLPSTPKPFQSALRALFGW